MGFWLVYDSMGRFMGLGFSRGSMCFFFWGSFLALSLGFCREIAKRDRCGCSLAHGCSPKHCFYRAKWTSKIRPPKVCSFIVKILCVVWKSLKNPSNIAIIALGKAFLSFSLRFCSTFKKHCKSRLKIEILPFKGDTLHTCSHEKRNFEVQLWKNDCGANTCAKCDRDFAFYCGFIVSHFCSFSFSSAFRENGPTNWFFVQNGSP